MSPRRWILLEDMVVSDERDMQHIGSLWKYDTVICLLCEADWPVFPVEGICYVKILQMKA